MLATGQLLPDRPMLTTGVVPSRIDALVGPDDPRRGRRLEWSRLLKRAYQLDVLICPSCAGPMRLVALIEEAGCAYYPCSFAIWGFRRRLALVSSS
jgi:hypothetical protein